MRKFRMRWKPKKLFVIAILAVTCVCGLSGSLSLMNDARAQNGVADALGQAANLVGAGTQAFTAINGGQQAQFNGPVSPEQQAIQFSVNQSIQELSNALQAGFQCLRSNSISQFTGSTSSALGTKCKPGKFDDALLDEDPEKLSCELANEIVPAGESQKKFLSCRATQLKQLNTIVGCFESMNSRVDSASTKLKELLNQLTQNTQNTLNSLDATIRGHEKVINLIDREMQGQDGYIAQVNDLDNISTALENALSDFAGNADRTTNQTVELNDGTSVNIPSGLRDRVKNFYGKEMDAIGNNWYRQLVGGVRSCVLGSGNTPSTFACDQRIGTTNGVFSCLNRLACQSATRAANFDGICERASQVLTKVQSQVTNIEIKTSQSFAGKFDLSTSDGRQAVIDKAFAETLKLRNIINGSFQQFSGGFEGFRGTASNIDYQGLVARSFKECEDSVAQQFNQQLGSRDDQGNLFQGSLTILESKEDNLKGDLDRTVDLVADKMTKLLTKFNSEYDNSLNQFAESCRARNDSRQKLACLEELNNRLKHGINGTNNEPFTRLQIPELNPQDPGNTILVESRCQGFKSCVKILENARRANLENIPRVMEQKVSVAQKHNDTIKQAIDQVAAVFNQSFVGPSGIQSLMSTVQKLLEQNGISGTIGLKPRDPESLVLNPDSNSEADAQIYALPNNVLDVMGQTIGLQQVDEDSICQVRSGSSCDSSGRRAGPGSILGKLREFGDETSEVNKLLSAAKRKRISCTPDGRFYRAISGPLKGCEDLNSVCSPGLPRMLASARVLGDKLADPSKEEKKDNEGFAKCLKDALDPTGGANPLLIAIAGKEAKVQELTPSQKNEAFYSCVSLQYDPVSTLLSTAKNASTINHDALLGHMSDLIGKCDEYDGEYLETKDTVDRVSSFESQRTQTDVDYCLNEEVPAAVSAVKENSESIANKLNDNRFLVRAIERELRGGSFVGIRRGGDYPAGGAAGPPTPTLTEDEVEETILDSIESGSPVVEIGGRQYDFNKLKAHATAYGRLINTSFGAVELAATKYLEEDRTERERIFSTFQQIFTSPLEVAERISGNDPESLLLRNRLGNPFAPVGDAYDPDYLRAVHSLVTNSRTLNTAKENALAQGLVAKSKAVECRIKESNNFDNSRDQLERALSSVDAIHSDGIQDACQAVVSEVDRLAGSADEAVDKLRSEGRDGDESGDDIVRRRRQSGSRAR